MSDADDPDEPAWVLVDEGCDECSEPIGFTSDDGPFRPYGEATSAEDSRRLCEDCAGPVLAALVAGSCKGVPCRVHADQQDATGTICSKCGYPAPTRYCQPCPTCRSVGARAVAGHLEPLTGARLPLRVEAAERVRMAFAELEAIGDVAGEIPGGEEPDSDVRDLAMALASARGSLRGAHFIAVGKWLGE
jgi:hypothetical protein